MTSIKTKAITANLLTTGEVVYLGSEGQWVSQLSDARLFRDEDIDDALAETSLRVSEITGAYTLQIVGTEAVGRERLRETIRSRGPTIHPNFGNQANAPTTVPFA